MASTRRLPAPLAEGWDWQEEGSCRDVDNAYFFHPFNERGSARAAREERAKQICLGCPVLEACREHALSVQESYGIWGGMGEGELREAIRMRRKQNT